MKVQLRTEAQHKRYNAVDLTKFIMSLLVIVIHVHPLGHGHDSEIANFYIMNLLPRLAVPFFFVISGFFLYKKTTLPQFTLSPSKAYLLKLLRLYLIWSVIYFPCSIDGIFYAGDGVFFGALRFVRDMFLGSYVHLWYLASTIMAVLVISLLLRAGLKPALIMAISSVLYLVGLLAQTWFGLIRPLQTLTPGFWDFLRGFEPYILSTRKGIFSSMIFVGIGMLFAYYKFNISRRLAYCGFFVSLALTFVEIHTVSVFGMAREYDFCVMLVPTVFFLVYIVLNTGLKDSPVYPFLRSMSTLVYFLHLGIKNIVYDLMYGFGFKDTPLRFAIIVAVTLIISFLLIKLSNVRCFKWLKYLYT